MAKGLDLPTWRTEAGDLVSCVEKIKVLNENLEEIRALAQEALEDAVLMECDEAQFRQVMHALADGLVNPYKKSGA
jgi:nitrogen fixation/metabolism regulation signal transduction histidine kinase